MKHFGQVLKKHIENNGLKKADVAGQAGLSYNYLSTIFHKESIDAALMERLCAAAGMSPMLVFENVPGVPKQNSDNNALGIFGNATIGFGINEQLYKDLLAEKERYIRSLEKQLEERDRNK